MDQHRVAAAGDGGALHGAVGLQLFRDFHAGVGDQILGRLALRVVVVEAERARPEQAMAGGPGAEFLEGPADVVVGAAVADGGHGVGGAVFDVDVVHVRVLEVGACGMVGQGDCGPAAAELSWRHAMALRERAVERGRAAVAVAACDRFQRAFAVQQLHRRPVQAHAAQRVGDGLAHQAAIDAVEVVRREMADRGQLFQRQRLVDPFEQVFDHLVDAGGVAAAGGVLHQGSSGPGTMLAQVD